MWMRVWNEEFTDFITVLAELPGRASASASEPWLNSLSTRIESASP